MTVISAAIEENGWVLAVRGNWGATAGAWEYGGFDRTNGRFINDGEDQFPLDPDGSPRLILHVTDAGYSRSGATAVPALAVPRTIIGAKVLRRPWPNKSELDEQDHGDGTRTVRIALSDRIFATSTITSCTFGLGWKRGEPAASVTVTNGSQRVVPLPISRWVTVPYQLIDGTEAAPRTSVRVDVLVASHYPQHLPGAPNQPVAAVAVQASDGVNSGAVSWLSIGESAEPDALLCWTGEVDLTGLSAGVITLHKTIYPFIGDARSTGSGHVANAMASTVQQWAQPLQFCFDPVGARYASRRKYVFVDTGSANTTISTSPNIVLHDTIAAARAAPITTKPANLTVAVQAFRDQGILYPGANGLAVTSGRGCEFWEILIHEGQTVECNSEGLNSASFWGSREGFLVIRGDPEASNPRASCAIQSRGSAGNIVVQRIKVTGCRVLLGHSNIFSNATNNLHWIDDCDVTAKPGYATNSFNVRATGGLWTTNLNCWGYNSQAAGGNLQRNIRRTHGARSLCHVNVTVDYESGVSGNTALFDLDDPDSMVWNLRASRWDGAIARADGQTSASGTLGAFASPHLLLRCALVNICVEGVNTRMLQLGEESYTQMNDCVWDGCTFVGDGVNFHNEPPWPLSWASGNVTVGLLAHGLLVGDSFTISGCMPAGYNGTYTVAAVLDDNRFTYVKSTNPGVMTVKGTISLPGDVVRELDFWNIRHTGNTLLGVYLDRNATKNDVWRSDGKVTGNWEILYGVGMRGKVHANRIAGSPQDWQYAYAGLGGLTNTEYATADGSNWAGFVDDASGHDGRPAAWNGDYRPDATSVLLGRGSVSNTNRTLDGALRGLSFPTGAYGPSVIGALVLAPDSAVHSSVGVASGLTLNTRVRAATAVLPLSGGAGKLELVVPVEGMDRRRVRTVTVEAERRTFLAGE